MGEKKVEKEEDFFVLLRMDFFWIFLSVLYHAYSIYRLDRDSEMKSQSAPAPAVSNRTCGVKHVAPCDPSTPGIGCMTGQQQEFKVQILTRTPTHRTSL